MIDSLYAGCEVEVISCGNPFYWYSSKIGNFFTVIEIRETYSDVIVVGGNCIDSCDIKIHTL